MSTRKAGRIEQDLVMIGCVLDVVRNYFLVLSDDVQKGAGCAPEEWIGRDNQRLVCWGSGNSGHFDVR